MINYIQKAKKLLSKEIDVENDLLNLYTLLVFSKAGNATLEDIHNAWAIWRNETKSDHKSLIPFEELSAEIQELDREYANAVNKTYWRYQMAKDKNRGQLISEWRKAKNRAWNEYADGLRTKKIPHTDKRWDEDAWLEKWLVDHPYPG